MTVRLNVKNSARLSVAPDPAPLRPPVRGAPAMGPAAVLGLGINLIGVGWWWWEQHRRPAAQPAPDDAAVKERLEREAGFLEDEIRRHRGNGSDWLAIILESQLLFVRARLESLGVSDSSGPDGFRVAIRNAASGADEGAMAGVATAADHDRPDDTTGESASPDYRELYSALATIFTELRVDPRITGSQLRAYIADRLWPIFRQIIAGSLVIYGTSDRLVGWSSSLQDLLEAYKQLIPKDRVLPLQLACLLDTMVAVTIQLQEKGLMPTREVLATASGVNRFFQNWLDEMEGSLYSGTNDHHQVAERRLMATASEWMVEAILRINGLTERLGLVEGDSPTVVGRMWLNTLLHRERQMAQRQATSHKPRYALVDLEPDLQDSLRDALTKFFQQTRRWVTRPESAETHGTEAIDAFIRQLDRWLKQSKGDMRGVPEVLEQIQRLGEAADRPDMDELDSTLFDGLRPLLLRLETLNRFGLPEAALAMAHHFQGQVAALNQHPVTDVVSALLMSRLNAYEIRCVHFGLDFGSPFDEVIRRMLAQ